MSSIPVDLGVHLVGSICGAPSAEAAFRQCCSSFPHRLRRIPDGEPAHRAQFIKWQKDVFSHTPEVMRQWDASFNSVSLPSVPDLEVNEIVNNMPALKTGYDDAALESYAVFRQLRTDGIIPEGVKFQVCLPTVAAVMCLVRDGFQAAVEPLYESALIRALKRIEAEIPKEGLAIQWDIATETMTLEGAYWPHFHPYWEGPVKEGAVERIARLANAVHPAVEMGLHICYGDFRNKHFVEPVDTGLMAEIVEGVLSRLQRPANWIHLPVPKNRDDLPYFVPLRRLDLGLTELYLGLVHAEDEEGTWRRIQTAAEALSNKKFGVATECGMGRTSAEKFPSIAKISTTVSSPVS